MRLAEPAPASLAGRFDVGDAAALPGLVVVATVVVWTARGGGYASTVWYPGALLLLVLLAAVAVGRALDTNRYALVAGLSFALFTLWSYASMGWAADKGIAWDGANRTLLYLTVFLLCAVLPWNARSAALAVGVYTVAVAVVGLVFFIRASQSAHPATYFLSGRLAQPDGYQNGNCASMMMAFWPALILAARREVPAIARPVLLASAGVLLDLALLSQSRGWLFSIPIVALVAVVVVPNRVRTLIGALLVTGAFLLALRRLLHVYTAARGTHLHAALVDARSAIFATAIVLLVGGALHALADRVWTPSPAVARWAGRAVGALAVSAAVAGAAVLFALADPTQWVEHGWRQFTHPAATGAGAGRGSYLTKGLGGDRYDAWRVAWRQFERHPLRGAGVDNYLFDYARERRSNQDLLYPHSLELRILGGTGAIGGVLFAVFLLAALASAFRRRPRGLARAVSAACLVTFAYWLVHGSVDWFWEIPALGGAAFAALGIASSLSSPGGAFVPSSGANRVRRVAGAAATAVVVVAAVSNALPWLSARYVAAAAHTWRAHPSQAFHALDRGARVNPLSAEPDLVAGAIASRLRDYARMETYFRRAVERAPRNWYGQLELAVAQSLLHERNASLRRLRLAGRLNPREPTIVDVLAAVRAGRRVSPAAIDRVFLRRVELLGR